MKNEFSIKKLLLFMLAFSIFWGLTMYVIDYGIPYLACIPHRISGEIWFQLISSWLLALPSIGICAYALIQTKKYHDLDEERLRPELLMESAEMSMCMVSWIGFDQWAYSKEGIGAKQREKYRQYRHKHSSKRFVNEESGKNDESDNLGYLDFNSNLILKGGESVSRITIQQITIQIGNRQYLVKFFDEAEISQNRSEAGANIFFDRNYKNGQEEYHITWQPDYKDIVFEKSEQELLQQKQGEVYVRTQKEFWNDMYNAVVDAEYDIARRDMEWQILMCIEYGINRTQRGKKSASADWRIRWDGENREFVNDYTIKQRSKEGIISIG